MFSNKTWIGKKVNSDSRVLWILTSLYTNCASWQQPSYQSEDQVIESRGGQQEQQDGEEQSSNEELQRAQL